NIAIQLDRPNRLDIQTGETKPDVYIVRSMLDLYDKYDEDLLDEVREARKPSWYRAFGMKNLGYVHVETEAENACQFVLVDVPAQERLQRCRQQR
ncbi:MAG: hypothetical protein ABW215_19265, partial [Kibdelosporangium sp.]